MPIIFLLVFFTVGNGFGKLPKDKSKKNTSAAGIDEAMKAWKKFQDSNGSIKGNIDILNGAMETLLKSNSSFKTGSLIAGIVDHTLNSLVNNDKEKLTIGHTHQTSNNLDRKIFRTKAYMGSKPNKELRAFANAPFYKKKNVKTRDSKRDWLVETAYRNELKIKCGVNERGTAFLNEETFLSVSDVLTLSNYDKGYVKKVKESLKAKLTKFGTDILKEKAKDMGLDEVMNEVEDILEDGGKKLFADTSSAGYTKHFTGILGTTCRLKLENTMPVYDANVAVHVVRLKNTDSKLNTVEKIARNLVVNKTKTSSPYLERITEEELYKHDFDEEKKMRIINKMTTDLQVKPTKLESFKENCIAVKSWRRKLNSGDMWYIDIYEQFRDGIYLNQLEELRTKKTFDDDMPVSYFLMIEFFGSNKAAVFRKRDEQTISSIYSPCLISCELVYEIDFICKTDDKNVPICYERTKETQMFEDSEFLEQAFYPERTEKFHIDFDNITIGDNAKAKDKKQQYRLELSPSILENQNMSMLESLVSKISKVDPDLANDLTEDDLPFLGGNRTNPDNSDLDDDDPKLRGGKS